MQRLSPGCAGAGARIVVVVRCIAGQTPHVPLHRHHAGPLADALLPAPCLLQSSVRPYATASRIAAAGAPGAPPRDAPYGVMMTRHSQMVMGRMRSGFVVTAVWNIGGSQLLDESISRAPADCADPCGAWALQPDTPPALQLKAEVRSRTRRCLRPVALLRTLVRLLCSRGGVACISRRSVRRPLHAHTPLRPPCLSCSTWRPAPMTGNRTWKPFTRTARLAHHSLFGHTRISSCLEMMHGGTMLMLLAGRRHARPPPSSLAPNIKTNNA